MSATIPTIDSAAASCTGKGIASQTRMVGWGGPLPQQTTSAHFAWTNLTPCYSVTDAHFDGSYKKVATPSLALYTRTWTTASAGTPLRRYDTSNNPPYYPIGNPWQEFCTPFYSGTPDPNTNWMLKRGRWTITVTTNIDATVPADDGLGGYALRMYAFPYRTNVNLTTNLAGAGYLTSKSMFYDGRVAVGADSKTTNFLLHSSPFWRVFIRTGALVSSSANGTPGLTISAQLNRTGV